MNTKKAGKYTVGDQVRLTHTLNGAWTKVGDEGVLTQISDKGYIVKLDFGAVIGGLDDNDLEPETL